MEVHDEIDGIVYLVKALWDDHHGTAIGVVRITGEMLILIGVTFFPGRVGERCIFQKYPCPLATGKWIPIDPRVEWPGQS